VSWLRALCSFEIPSSKSKDQSTVKRLRCRADSQPGTPLLMGMVTAGIGAQRKKMRPFPAFRCCPKKGCFPGVLEIGLEHPQGWDMIEVLRALGFRSCAAQQSQWGDDDGLVVCDRL
jgi:hypothetical protein